MDIREILICEDLGKIRIIDSQELDDVCFSDEIYTFKKKTLRNIGLLHFSILSFKLDSIETLLTKGINANKYCDGWTPLHLASFLGYSEIVDLLLFHEADPHLLDKYKMSAISIAINEGFIDVVDSLLVCRYEPSELSLPLQIAIQAGKPLIVEKLLQSGADPELPSINGKTPISFIDEEKQKDILDLISSFKKVEYQNRLQCFDGSIKSLSQMMIQIPIRYNHKETEIVKYSVKMNK